MQMSPPNWPITDPEEAVCDYKVDEWTFSKHITNKVNKSVSEFVCVDVVFFKLVIAVTFAVTFTVTVNAGLESISTFLVIKTRTTDY